MYRLKSGKGVEKVTYVIETDWNPIVKIRLSKGMNTYQFAEFIGISRVRLYQIEHGQSQKLSKKVLAAVAKLGFNPQQVQHEYLAWLERQTEAPVRVR